MVLLLFLNGFAAEDGGMFIRMQNVLAPLWNKVSIFLGTVSVSLKRRGHFSSHSLCRKAADRRHSLFCWTGAWLVSHSREVLKNWDFDWSTEIHKKRKQKIIIFPMCTHQQNSWLSGTAKMKIPVLVKAFNFSASLYNLIAVLHDLLD